MTACTGTDSAAEAGAAEARGSSSEESASSSDASVALSLAEGFALIQGDAVWPVSGTTADDLSSTFGPRIRQSTQDYDFHRGIDIHATTGDAVVAAFDGTLHGVRLFPDGGLSVVIDHELPEPVLFHGRPVRAFHTFSMHLDTVTAEISAAAAADEPLKIPAGSVIGTAGESGATTDPHLHFEVRLGSRCSLEYQLTNPDSTCEMTGVDPHIHPLYLLRLLLEPAPSTLAYADEPDRYPAPDPPFAIHGTTTDSAARFTVTGPDDNPTLDRYEVIITESTEPEEPLVLDLSERIGFDATSTQNLDRPDWTTVHLDPQPFGTRSSEWDIEVVVPLAGRTEQDLEVTLTVVDVFGDSWSQSLSVSGS